MVLAQGYNDGESGIKITGLALQAGCESAIIILHEIYGINPHIQEVCESYHALGYDVYCPNLISANKPFSYLHQQEAYEHFHNHGGFAISNQITELLAQIRPQYKAVFLIGFSIGATIAWICSASGLCSGIVGYYGSRIRDYLTTTPQCASLLFFARHEASFSPEKVTSELNRIPHTQAIILEGHHGFCDTHTPNFCKASAKKAENLTQEFLKQYTPL